MRFVLFLSSCIAMANAAFATTGVADYCAAYARDYADLDNKQKQDWQKRFDNAQQTCTDQFALTPRTPAPKKTTKAVVKATPMQTKPVKNLTPVPAAPTPDASPKIPKLVAGSPEWLAYCKNKYVSFNATTGSYLSKTGVERKCLVTAD